MGPLERGGTARSDVTQWGHPFILGMHSSPEQGQGSLGTEQLLIPWVGHGHRGGTL